MFNKDTPKHETCVPCVGKGFNPPWPTEVGPTPLKSALRHASLVGCGRCFTLTSMFNKDAPKHETCVPCVGKGFNPPWPTEVGPTTLKSALRHAILVSCGRCFTLTSMFNKDTPKHETCLPCVGKGFNTPWPTEVGHTTLKSALRHAILVSCGR